MGLNTSYSACAAASAGMLAFLDTPYVTVSRAVETAAGIGFGKVVSRGTDHQTQVALGGASPFGIAFRSHEYGNDSTDDEDYDQYDAIPVFRSGYIWATIADTANAGALLNYNTTTGAIGAGAAGAGEALLPGELVTDSTAGGLAIIYVDCHVCSVSSILTDAVVDTDYTAYSILYADTISTPAALTVGASTIVGRKSSGGIVALTPTETKVILGTNAATAIDDNVTATAVDIDIITDESEVTAVLDGSATKYFVPLGVFLCVKTKTGTIAGDGTLNIGTSTGGTQIKSAQALTSLDTIGDGLYIDLAPAAGACIAGNATIYFNVEKADTTGTALTLNAKIWGKQISIA